MAASCGRWVTQSTCLRRLTWASFSATFWAARPETPVSTSSKTRVPMSSCSERTFFRASMIRASSPPEAIFAMGFMSSPALADIRKRMASQPSWAGSLGSKQISKRTFLMSSSRSSVWMRCCRSPAAAFRAFVRASPAVRTFPSAAESFRSRQASSSSEVSMVSSSRRQRSRYASMSSAVAPYFFFRR